MRLIDGDALQKIFEGLKVKDAHATGSNAYDLCAMLTEDAPTIEALIIPESGIGELSDGYHTFNELYHHRAVLFSVICNLSPQNAWKSKLHDTEDMYDGMFIVGINTAEGQATYHYDIDPYWEMFKVKELPRAPKWDGHTPDEAICRIGNIKAEPVRHGEWVPAEGEGESPCDEWDCTACKQRRTFMYEMSEEDMSEYYPYCPNCGAKMKGGDQHE